MASARELLAKTKADVLAARIAGLSFDDKGWLGAARSAAFARLNAMGLPVKRDEYWRYTDPSTLTSAAVKAAAIAPQEAAFAEIETLKIVFNDGIFDEAASGDLAVEGLEIELLTQAALTEGHWAKDLYGALEANGQTPVERPLAAFNTAFATNGLIIRAKGVASKAIELIYNQKSETSDAILHHVVKAEEGASVTILESGAGAARFNSVLEVEIADRGAFHHIRTQGRDQERRSTTHLFTRLGEESLFKSFTLTANGRLTRNETVIEFAGNDAKAHVAGACIAEKDFHHDDTVFITHNAVNCESRQVFKKVLKSGAIGVFQGKILVKQIAQKTDGYQISQALLLDDDSQFLCKPELEIYADDVKCSHGSTSGAIDETALFYLQSRGVPRAVAQSLLVQAFLAEAIDEIADEAIAGDIQARLEAWL